MAEDAKSVPNLPVANTLLATDKLLCLANVVSSNGGNCALISTTNFTGNSAAFLVNQSDPSSSSAWTGPAGALFFSPSYGYVAILPNTLKRFPISSF